MTTLETTNTLRLETLHLQQELAQHLLIAPDFRNQRRIDELEELIQANEMKIKELYSTINAKS